MGAFHFKADKDAVLFLVGLGLPEELVEAPAAAVDAVFPIVFVQVIGLAPQGESRPAYAAGKAADGGAEKWTVMGIAVQGGIPEQQVLDAFLAGGDPEGRPGCPQGGDGEGYIPRIQGVEPNLFARGKDAEGPLAYVPLLEGIPELHFQYGPQLLHFGGHGQQILGYNPVDF